MVTLKPTAQTSKYGVNNLAHVTNKGVGMWLGQDNETCHMKGSLVVRTMATRLGKPKVVKY